MKGAVLRKYLDANMVTLWVNPEHIVVVVMNRQGPGHPFEATFTLIDGTKFRLWDNDPRQLCGRVVAGDV